MTHREKVDLLIEELEEEGVNAFTVAPPLFRLLWLFGLKVPPPLFLGFFTLTVLFGIFFGVLWGEVMWLLQWKAGLVGVEIAVLISALAGLLFGLTMAGYYRWKAASLDLPSWKRYGKKSRRR